MKLIHSKDIYYITRDVLKLLDPKIMNHGARTAYILYRMLELTGKYEMYELAEFAYIATLHDFGAYETDYLQDQLKYEGKDCMPHSIYGYLFLLHLTPFKDRAKIILYHHTDYNQVPSNGYDYIDVIHCLNVAEKMDMYSNILGNKFDYKMFEKQAGTKYSARALGILYQAQKKFDVFGKLSSGEYKQELAELMEYLIFTNEEKRDLLLGLMYSISFLSEYKMYDIVACVHISEQIGRIMMLPQKEQEVLYYASILHDAGMCAIPKEVVDFPGKLDQEQYRQIMKHVEIIEEILKGRVDQEVLDVISAHHERCDGTGYPRRLRDAQMTKLQKIMQVADIITSLISDRSYRPAKSKAEVIDILQDASDRGKLSKEIVKIVIKYYDDVVDGIQEKTKDMIDTYTTMRDSYQKTYKNIKPVENE